MANIVGISSEVLDEVISFLIAAPLSDDCSEAILAHLLDTLCATNNPHRDITHLLEEMTEAVTAFQDGDTTFLTDLMPSLQARWQGVLTTIPEPSGLPRGVHLLPRVRPLLLAASRLLLQAWQEAEGAAQGRDLETIYRTCVKLWTQVVGWVILDEGTAPAHPHDDGALSAITDLEITIHTRLLNAPMREHRGTLVAIPETDAWFCTECMACVAATDLREAGAAHRLLPAYARSWDAALIVARMVCHDADLRAAFATIVHWPQDRVQELPELIMRLTPERVCWAALLAYLHVHQ